MSRGVGAMWAYLTGAAGPSGYGSATTAAHVARDLAEHLRGKVVLVTGAAGGIGFEAARAMAEVGATVYVTARSAQQAEDAAQRIRAQLPSATVKSLAIDLSSLASIKQGADAFLATGDPLHVLLNNAGTTTTAAACPTRRTACACLTLGTGCPPRGDGVAAPADPGRGRAAVWHQPPGPLLPDRAAPAQAEGIGAIAHRQRLQQPPSRRPTPRYEPTAGSSSLSEGGPVLTHRANDRRVL
jgi:hypothetical protein